MGRFKSAMSFLGDAAVALSENNEKVNDMTRELVRRGYNVDAIEARKIAQILVSQATVTWK